MTHKNCISAPDQEKRRSGGRQTLSGKLPELTKLPANIGFADDRPAINALPQDETRSGTIKELLTVVQAAALLACNVKTIRRRCIAGQYPGAAKQLGNGGEGWLIPIASLPKAAQKAFARQFAAALLEKNSAKNVAINAIAPLTPAAQEASVLQEGGLRLVDASQATNKQRIEGPSLTERLKNLLDGAIKVERRKTKRP